MSEFRPWLKKYPHGIPANINPEEYTTVVELLEQSFKKYAKKTAFSCMDKAMTYEQIDKYSRDFGAYLLSRGLEPGDKIAIMMPNLLQYPIALFGALRAGLIVVNTNPLYKPREMEHQFKDSGAVAIIIAENYASNLQQILPNTAIKTVITTSIGELLGFPRKIVVNFVVRSLKRMVPKYEILNAVSFTEALTQGKKFQIPAHTGKSDDVIVLQYTGGTTGVSKGAMLTNGNLVSNMLQVKAWCEPFLRHGDEIALCPLPLYHIFAFTVNVLCLMSFGAHNVLVTNARDIPSVIKAMQGNAISVITGVNTLFNALLNNPDFAKLDFSKLKVSSGGGMAVQKAVAEKWQQVTGCYLSEGYGLTETSPVATTNPYDGTGKIGSIGIPLPSTDLRIVDEQGHVVGPNQIGEIQIKGPQVMKGYYNQPEETAQMIVDGWLLTGDIGLMHEDGYFQIVDRKKDMILVSAFNVYPNEIEDVIAAHPKVLEVAAIGVPDAKSTEAVKVFIVKKDKSLNKEEIIAYCRENLTAYKVPRHVEFRDELPKTNVGKILRRALKES
ncbi:MAG: AMP-binding protein [Haliscomenobacter sp.]|nr:AMP-binding protein [Haliscomenobacter sp.]MBK9487589.1 AMP-binding protein [Haliscomenobacter sp.]